MRNLTAEDVRQLIVSRAAGAQSQWAHRHGLSDGYVSDVLRHRREPGPKMLAALGLQRVVVYRRAD